MLCSKQVGQHTVRGLARPGTTSYWFTKCALKFPMSQMKLPRNSEWVLANGTISRKHLASGRGESKYQNIKISKYLWQRVNNSAPRTAVREPGLCRDITFYGSLNHWSRWLHITAGPPSYSTGFQPACSRKWERRSSLDRVDSWAFLLFELSWYWIDLLLNWFW